MDLPSEAQRLQLDLLAVEACTSLERAGIPHALIKGPSTSLWLYDPPRLYNDVDLLVPSSRLEEAAEILRSNSIVVGELGATGAEGSHSHVLTSTLGYEIDLHASVPTVPLKDSEDDTVWSVLSRHLTPLDLGVGVVPALDDVGRCLVIALHALPAFGRVEQRVEDLQRAAAAASDATWDQARELAASMDAADLFDAGRQRAAVQPDLALMSRRSYLEFTGASPYVMSIERLRTARGRQRIRLLTREIWPTSAFIAQAEPDLKNTHWWAVRGRVRRARRLVQAVPEVLRELQQRTRRE